MTAKNRAIGASTATPEAGTTANIYHITLHCQPGVSSFTIRTGADDLLTEKAAQLRSLLMLTCGISRENFASLHDSDQDNVLWLAQDLAHEINLLAEILANGGGAA